jgi:hypothetical protein
MQNCAKSEKSRGLVSIAFNTATTDYVSIAEQTLKLASHVLQLPYTLITESDVQHVNNRYDIDTQQFVPWHNAGRYLAYEQSPYDETLVIDADYLVLDHSLQQVFDLDFDYMFVRNARGLRQDFPDTMGPHSLKYVWATVFAFRKNKKSTMFFDLVKRIQKNYAYYRDLFNIEQRNYRNDYAFAIAEIILNGHQARTCSIPGTMINVDQPITDLTIQGDFVIVRDEHQAYVLPKTNLHVMSKAYLQTAQFQEFVHNVVT